MKKYQQLWQLFVDFCKLGCFTFGGGYSIVAQMQRIYVEERKCISNEDLLDMTSLARSLPGAMIGNVGMLYGYRTCGILGGLSCVVGMTLAPMAMLSLIALFYTVFRENLWIAAAMEGIRAAVVPIIGSAALGMVKGAFKYRPCILVMLLALGMYLMWNVSCVNLVLFGGVCGILICEWQERRQGGKVV